MNVLKRLRLQVIFSIVSVLMLILAAILFALDVSVHKRERAAAFRFLQTLSENDGRRPRPRKAPTSRGDGDIPSRAQKRFGFPEIRDYFSVRVAEDGDVLEVVHDFPLGYTIEEIEELVKKVSASGKEKGVSDGMCYLLVPQGGGGILMCFANRRGEFAVLRRFYAYSAMIYAASLLAAVVFAWFISGFVVRPVKAAFEKQRQFVADASHELKTPIAIIGANLDVLMPDFEGNRWLGYIREENERMSRLVKNLLFLARNDSDGGQDAAAEFDFSRAVGGAVLPFESVIFEEGKTLELAVEERMAFTGDEGSIRQVVVILVDNAIKNSEKGALIRVRAFSEGSRRVVTVYNTGEGVPAAEREKIFLRFYRSDSSRARKTGGYGLGLPIAQEIARKHNGTITVDGKEGEWVEFTFSISSRKRLLPF